MIAEDLIENLMKQKINTDEAAKSSNKLLFVDTDALTTRFYSNFLLKANSPELRWCLNLADAISPINNWDLVLFLEPTVNFVQDGTRNETIAADRTKYSNLIKELFDINGIKYEVLDGDYLDRFNKAKKLIEEKFGVKTIW
jgi:HTH-type transcriptional repressor of NAD biosynthesis genes